MKILSEILFLCILYLLAVGFSRLIPFSIPPALIGMGLLFLLLATGVIRTRQLEKSSQFLSRHMVLFFIPIMAGVLQYWGILKQGGWYLLLTIVLSTAFVIIFTAFITTICKRRER